MRGNPRVSFALVLLGLLVGGTACRQDDAADGAGADTTGTIVAGPPVLPTTNTVVPYGTLDTLTLSGYMAVPQTTAASPGDTLFPAVIVVHDEAGLDDNMQGLTRQLGGHGFRALAVDLYTGHDEAAPGEASAILNKGRLPDEADILRNITAAQQYLQQTYGAQRVGIVGWGVGGRAALAAAIALPAQLGAAVVYDTPPDTDREVVGTLGVPLLALYGGQDPVASLDDLRAFETALREAGKQAEVHVYENAGAGFADATGEHYAADAAQDAWRRATDFLKQHLQPAGSTPDTTRTDTTAGAAPPAP